MSFIIIYPKTYSTNFLQNLTKKYSHIFIVNEKTDLNFEEISKKIEKGIWHLDENHLYHVHDELYLLGKGLSF